MARPRLLTLEVSVKPTQAVRALRELAEAAGWSWTREEGARLVDRWMVIMPIARTTRTFRIAITEGEGTGIILTAWEETGGSLGGVTKVEWVIPVHLEGAPRDEMLRAWVARHPRCPWRWSLGERSLIGFFLPVWRRSRRTFASLGLDTRRSAWPQAPPWPPEGWPDSREEE